MGKTQIGELFFKERLLRLPSPLPQRLRLAISEKSLRLLIMGLIILFLLSLGTSLFLQLMQSRSMHLSEQNHLAALHGRIAAQGIRMAYGQPFDNDRTVPPMNSGLLAQMLAPEALAEARIFAIADATGVLVTTLPVLPHRLLAAIRAKEG